VGTGQCGIFTRNYKVKQGKMTVGNGTAISAKKWLRFRYAETTFFQRLSKA
jgi:hypothetical protein